MVVRQFSRKLKPSQKAVSWKIWLSNLDLIRRLGWLWASLGMLILLLALPGSGASAQGRVVDPVLTQQDLDGDGAPDLTVLGCSFSTDVDQVLVYDRNGNMPWSDEWQTATDFEDDLWIFDAGSDGTAQLIIAFSFEDGRQTAYLYDDQDQDGRVEYEATGTAVEITESQFWRLKVVAGSTWMVGERVSAELKFFWDGAGLRADMPQNYLDSLPVDGEIDFEWELVDWNRDMIPDYSLGRLLAPSPQNWAMPRAGLRVNSGSHNPAPPEGYLFWPLLDADPLGAEVKFFDYPPTVAIDWSLARVQNVRLPGYPIETNSAGG